MRPRSVNTECRTWTSRSCNVSTTNASRRAMVGRSLTPASFGSRHSLVVLHGCPESVRVQPRHVVLAAFSGAARHDGLALVVHLQHQRVRLRLRVTEELLEDVGDVVHQVDRIVPHEHDPRPVGPVVGVAEKLLDRVGDDDLLGADLRPRRHHDSGRSSAAIRDKSPFTNRPESLVEYCLANSTASVMATAVGTSGNQPSSYVPRRNNARSTTGIRSSDQCSENFAMMASICSWCSSTPSTSCCAYSSGGTGRPASSTDPLTSRCSHSYARPRARSRAALRVGTDPRDSPQARDR